MLAVGLPGFGIPITDEARRMVCGGRNEKAGEPHPEGRGTAQIPFEVHGGPPRLAGSELQVVRALLQCGPWLAPREPVSLGSAIPDRSLESGKAPCPSHLIPIS